jgi:broad-specificity NMP kinase
MTGTIQRLLFVTGASGVGKTTTLMLLQQRRPDILVRYFDEIIPPLEEMIKRYGSGEEWQRQNTIKWISRIKAEDLGSAPVILDGQARQAFVEEACSLAGLSDYRIILFDCEDAVREKRLFRRGHPELANNQMKNWARYLREQAANRGDPIIDTTWLTVENAVTQLLALGGFVT